MNLAYWQMHDMGGGTWFYMGLGAVAVWGLLVWTVVSLRRGRFGQSRAATAGEILDRRLADGEISTDEYERLRDALRPPGPTTAAHR